mmetsp:Transcript_10731/g.16059  ORF Transcript_10731/g.16059 Transcript_10731/m.16059 type:complete len:218 (+) Transcript_10731:26-679(+)
MDIPEKAVVVLRHGQSANKVNLNFRPDYSCSDDPSLTELGKEQARNSSLLLSNLIPPNKSIKVVTSPFQLCLETAYFLSQKFQLKPTLDYQFSEFLNDREYFEDPLPKLSLNSCLFNVQEEFTLKEPTKTPQFPETYQEMEKRVTEALKQALEELEEDVLVIVTHYYVLEVLTSYMLGRPERNLGDGYCALTLATFESNQFNVKVKGDYTHAPQYIR